MMADPKKQPLAPRRALNVVSNTADEGQACTTCHSNEWIWDEEVELVRAMNGVKQRVRDAHVRGDERLICELRDEFASLRAKMEKVRRKRLDSLGHYDYD